LGQAVEAHRDSFSYSGAAWDRENAVHLRRRQIRELVKPGETNVKSSAGGLIDIEYFVQYLQLQYGKDHPELRVPTTLQALDELRRLQIITEPEYQILQPGYLFLRNLIDALRIVRGDPSDLLLPDKSSDDFKSLARRLGYREHDRATAASRLAEDVHQWMKKVHGVFMDRFGKERN
jgi:[glutamine synthetase] adenylyltransferase / [glutamine synthetase]-adenylyl-L-tyrosine phosphorylase